MTSPLPPSRPGLAYVSSPVASMVLMATKWGRATHPDHRTSTREQVIEGPSGGAIKRYNRETQRLLIQGAQTTQLHRNVLCQDLSNSSPHPHFWTDPDQCRQAKCASEFPSCEHLLRLPVSSEKCPSLSALPVPGPVHLRLLQPGDH